MLHRPRKLICALACCMIVISVSLHFAQGQAFAQTSDEEGLRQRRQRMPEKSIAEQIIAVPTVIMKLPFFLTGKGIKYTAVYIDEIALIPRTKALLMSDDGLVALYPTASWGGRAGLGMQLKFFNKRFLKKGNRLSFQTSYSANSHQDHYVRYKIPELMGPISLYMSGGYQVKTNEDFFGIPGNDSERDDRTNFRHEELGGEMTVGFAWAKSLHTRLLIDYTDHVLEDGDGVYDSTLGKFDLQTTPGLDGAALLGVGGSIALDTRDNDFYSSRGALAKLSATVFNQVDDGDYGFTRYTLELCNYLTLFRPGRILAVRLRGEINTRLSDDKDTPFFERATLGGADTLRGYSTGRFRDKDLVLLNVEYRYPIWEAERGRTGAMDAVLFMDVGRVFNDLTEDAFADYKTSYGVGIRARTPEDFVFRAEIARSSEETNLIFEFGPIF